jgi:hypothetical protein
VDAGGCGLMRVFLQGGQLIAESWETANHQLLMLKTRGKIGIDGSSGSLFRSLQLFISATRARLVSYQNNYG